jgi:hypothetical protein
VEKEEGNEEGVGDDGEETDVNKNTPDSVILHYTREVEANQPVWEERTPYESVEQQVSVWFNSKDSSSAIC